MFCFELQSWEQYSNLIEFEYNIKLVKTENAYSKKHLILTSRKRQHKKKKHTLLIHFVLAMLSTFLGGFNFGHFTFPHRIQNQTKIFYCITYFRPPCAIYSFRFRRERLGRIPTADQTLFKYGGKLRTSGLNRAEYALQEMAWKMEKLPLQICALDCFELEEKVGWPLVRLHLEQTSTKVTVWYP